MEERRNGLSFPQVKGRHHGIKSLTDCSPTIMPLQLPRSSNASYNFMSWRLRLPNARLVVQCVLYYITLLAAIAMSKLYVTAPTAHDSDLNSSSTIVGEWIEETGFYQSMRLTPDPPIYSRQSKYQLIEVHQSPYYGKVLVLDGVVQLTERDADAYNEMLAHVPLFQHKNPRRVLIVGGGDGYVLSEVLKHGSVEHVDHVDLDADMVDACKMYFGRSTAWSDPRVKLHIADGAAFVRNATNASYDVIIQDSSDPWTWGKDGEQVVLPSSVLYSEEHFKHIHRILKPNGILNLQAETLQIPSDMNGIRDWRRLALSVGFGQARYGTIMISSYPTGQIGFLLCEKDKDEGSNQVEINERYAQMVKEGKGTNYYHPPQQVSAFVLPLWAERLIYDLHDGVPPNCLPNETSNYN